MFKKTRSAANLVGLDLDPGHLAAAEVTVNGSVTVTRGAVAHLRPGILRDGEVADPAGLTDALNAFFAEHELPKRVRLGIASQRIVVRTLDVAPLEDPKGLAAAVQMEAPDHIPMPMDEAIIDFQSLGLVDTPLGRRTRVVVVAVRRESIERLTGAARAAGLRIEGIDLSAFAMVRALAPAGDPSALLYINVAGLTNVAVANAVGCLFTRAASGGFDVAVGTLADRRSLTVEHARQWLTHVGLDAPVGEVEGEQELVSATRGVLEETVHQLADTVRNSLNFYRTQTGAEAVGRAVLTGPVVDVPGFTDSLARELRLPVQGAPASVADDLELDAGRLAVAAGLAVERRN